MGITPNHPDLPSSRQVIFPGSNFGYGSSDDPSTNCSYPMTPAYCAHGNACAGIIAATMDNEEGISGIAPECKIMPVRYDGLTTSTAPKGGFADGIVFAAAHGADIISNS